MVPPSSSWHGARRNEETAAWTEPQHSEENRHLLVLAIAGHGDLRWQNSISLQNVTSELIIHINSHQFTSIYINLHQFTSIYIINHNQSPDTSDLNGFNSISVQRCVDREPWPGLAIAMTPRNFRHLSTQGDVSFHRARDSKPADLVCAPAEGWYHMGMDQYLLIPFLVGWTSI